MTSLLFPGCRGVSGHGGLPGQGGGCDGDEIWNSFYEGAATSARGRMRDGFLCYECNSEANVEMCDDELICRKCGTQLGFNIDSSAEYRWFGADDRNPDPSRVGNPLNPLLPESSLGTRILYRPGDSKAMRKIRQYHLWNIMPYRERTLWGVFEGLHVRASNAGISLAIVEETKQLYAQVSPRCICRGPQKDALLAACLFESLKRHDTPRRPAEIALIFQIDPKLITRGVKQFSGLLEEHLHAEAKKCEAVAAVGTLVVGAPVVAVAVAAAAAAPKDTPTATAATAAATTTASAHMPSETPSTSFKHYLEPAIYRLETPRVLHGQLLGFAVRVGDLIDELGICPETTPSSLAASSLSLACEKYDIAKSNADIARVCSISAATLQKCLKRIDSWRSVLFKE